MFDSVFIMFILALMPIIWLIIALCGLKLQAHVASVGACIVAFIEAIFIWKMPVNAAFSAALEGTLADCACYHCGSIYL